MPESEKIQVCIYQLETHLSEQEDFDEVIESIIKKVNLTARNFKEDRLSRSNFDDFKVRIFYDTKTTRPKWQPFLKKILAQDSFLARCQNTIHSFILFIAHKNRAFAITGGSGSFTIDRFVSQTFGIEILTRLIEKNSKVIKSIQDRGVTGAVLGQTRFYRGDQRLSDENQFGKIYKQVRAELNKKILTSIFGFKATDLKREVSGCLAKTSFQINKTLNFDAFLRVVSKLNTLLDQEPNFSLNNVQLISKKAKNNLSLIETLWAVMLEILYKSCIEETVPDFDFCHRDFEKYLTAAYYKIADKDNPKEYSRPIVLFSLIKELKNDGALVLDNFVTLKYSLLHVQIETFDEEGVLLTSGNFFEHLHGEVNYKGKTYFLIDCEWYEIQDDFIINLNIECEDILEQAWDATLLVKPFDLRIRERDYNEKYITQEGFLVFDTITPENIEACDILKYDHDSVYLIHVKKGFNNSIRDLSAQISIAARRISQDRKTGYAFINELELLTKRGKYSSSDYMKKLATQSFPAKGVKEIFSNKKDRKINFCLAFVDTATIERHLKNNIELFDSNIAKYSLIELRNQVNALGFEFKIMQLMRGTS